jgi:hypothetical protein
MASPTDLVATDELRKPNCVLFLYLWDSFSDLHAIMTRVQSSPIRASGDNVAHRSSNSPSRGSLNNWGSKIRGFAHGNTVVLDED